MLENPTRTIWLLGSTGRLGAPLGLALSKAGHSVTGLLRSEFALLRNAKPGDVILNAAGKAHVPARPTPTDVEALTEANVDLPAELAMLSISGDLHLVHLSSTKAASPGESLYGYTKWMGERELVMRCQEFEIRGLCLSILRPCAVVTETLGRGKLGKLAAVSRLHSVAPPLPVPAMTLETLETKVASVIEEIETTPIDRFDGPWAPGSNDMLNLRTALKTIRTYKSSR